MNKEKLDELKEVYGDIFEIKVGDKVGYFKRPTLKVWQVISDLYTSEDDLDGDMELAKGCFVGGDVEMIDFEDNADLFFSYKDKLDQLLLVYPASIESVEGNITTIKCNDKEVKVKFPSFKDMKVILAHYDAEKYFKANELLLKYGMIEGDEVFKYPAKYPEYLVSIRGMLSTIINIQSSSLKKK